MSTSHLTPHHAELAAVLGSGGLGDVSNLLAQVKVATRLIVNPIDLDQTRVGVRVALPTTLEEEGSM